MADEWDPVPSTRHRGDVVDPEDSRGNGGAHNIDLEKQKPDMVEDEESSSETSRSTSLAAAGGSGQLINMSTAAYVQLQSEQGVNPRQLLEDCLMPGVQLSPDLSSEVLWRIVVQVLSESPSRAKLPNVNTIEDVVDLVQSCSNILVITGAGISVSCGIPDFRSRNGIYARLAVDFPELPEPQSMFDIHFFRIDPRPFFRFAKEIFPGQFAPSPSHCFIASLEKKGKLLRNYTQNIDTLEQAAGITRVIQCHGSFLTASCTRCKYSVPGDDIKEEIMNEVVPECPKCREELTKAALDDPESEEEEVFAVMKPDIVFFGEQLPEEFHEWLQEDLSQADLLIVIGSSLKVRPVALVPSLLASDVPQILINKETLPHLNFDVELLGYCDDIVRELTRRLQPDWEQGEGPRPHPSNEPVGGYQFVPPNRYLFPGADCTGQPRPPSTVSEVGTEQDAEERCALLSEGGFSRRSSISGATPTGRETPLGLPQGQTDDDLALRTEVASASRDKLKDAKRSPAVELDSAKRQKLSESTTSAPEASP